MKRLINWIKSLFRKYSYVFFVGSENALPEPLSLEDEIKYVKEYESGSIDAKNKLIEHNLRLVVFLAKKYDNTKVDLEDLVSIGTIGLIKGINTYKLDKKIKLATYASRCIDNEILMYLRKNKKRNADISLEDSDMKLLLMKEIQKLPKRDYDIMKLRYGLFGEKEVTQKELAEKLNISQSYISRIEKKVIKRIKETVKL